MSNATILFRYAEVGDIITHSGSYNEYIFLSWTDDHKLHCQPTEETMQINRKFGVKSIYRINPYHVTHLNRQLLRVIPLMGEVML